MHEPFFTCLLLSSLSHFRRCSHYDCSTLTSLLCNDTMMTEISVVCNIILRNDRESSGINFSEMSLLKTFLRMSLDLLLFPLNIEGVE